MATIQIGIPAVSDNVKTFISQDYSSGTSISVDSSVGLSSGNYIVVGDPGLENTEITHLTSSPPDSSTLTVSTLNFSHPKGTPIYQVNWDKFSLEYKTSATGNWNVYSDMPLALHFDAQQTEYRDALATSTYQWRYRYYSTEKGAYSDYSPIIGATGWGRSSVGYMVREIRKIVNDPDGKTVTDTEIVRFLNAAQDKIFTMFDRWWFLLKVGTSIPTVAGQKTYSLPSDFGRMHSVQFNYVSGSSNVTYDLDYKSITEFDRIIQDNNAGNDDSISFYSIYPGDSTNPTGYLKISGNMGGGPSTAGLSIIPRYYKTFNDLSEYSDETEVPIPEILENYVIGMIYDIRKEDDKAGLYLGSLQKPGQFYQQIELLKQMQRRSARPMRYLWEFKGRNSDRRYFGNRQTNIDKDREDFW